MRVDKTVFIWCHVFVLILAQIWLHFDSLGHSKSIKNERSPLTRWTPILTKMELSIEYPSKTDFWWILDLPRPPQDLSKAAQDASRRLQIDVKTLPRRLKTPLDTSKTGSHAIHFWQETFLSWQRTMNRSESTKYSSEFTIYSFIFTIHNLQVRVSSSAFTVHSWRFTCYTALPSTLHQKQDSHAQTKSTTFELKSLNSCFSASRLIAQINIHSTTTRTDSGAPCSKKNTVSPESTVCPVKSKSQPFSKQPEPCSKKNTVSPESTVCPVHVESNSQPFSKQLEPCSKKNTITSESTVFPVHVKSKSQPFSKQLESCSKKNTVSPESTLCPVHVKSKSQPFLSRARRRMLYVLRAQYVLYTLKAKDNYYKKKWAVL